MNKIEIICSIIGSIALILGGVWFIIKRAFNSGEKNQILEEINKRTCNANCVIHDKDIEILKCDLKEMWNDIITIKSLLLIKHKDAANIFSVKNSPRKLNENGLKLYAEIKGDKFLEANKNFLFSKINEFKPKTALDVENAANAACTANVDNEIFNNLKNYVYNSPSFEIIDKDGEKKSYDISMSDVCFVLSIPLRDMYIKEHPEININGL